LGKIPVLLLIFGAFFSALPERARADSVIVGALVFNVESFGSPGTTNFEIDNFTGSNNLGVFPVSDNLVFLNANLALTCGNATCVTDLGGSSAAFVLGDIAPPSATSQAFSAFDEFSQAVFTANFNLTSLALTDGTTFEGSPSVSFTLLPSSGQFLVAGVDQGTISDSAPVHGGDHYAGKFPEDGSGFADVGGHFLPYDVGNFDFSSKPGLTKCDQEEAIYSLNQNVLNARPTTAEKELIAGWYANNNGSRCSNVVHVLDEFFVPKSCQDAQSQNPQVDIVGFYQKVNARSCRTCHVAMIEGYNFDHYANLTSANTDRFAIVGFDNGINICGGSLHFQRDHMMPNSLVTFNRFWLSADPNANITPLPNQLELTSNFFLATSGGFGSFNANPPCPTPAGTTP